MSYNKEIDISAIFNTSEGRAKLAQAMIAPIRRSMDYQGIARKALSILQLPTYYYMCC